MALALYRKYRSKKLSELVGQEHVTTTLSNALKSGDISHAYLLTGPRGTGKTSIARILAHEINGIPYDDDNSHLDIIEIDAASSRGIEEIRDLREKARLAPSQAKYKVYILDEVHMLTTHAFNALLKTLEEPPSHVIFILVTTELHKLPETIVSRTQRYGFKPISIEAMVPHLRMIATKESIVIDDAALRLIADHANGGFRDAISLLDQARSMSKKITSSTIEDMIGLPPRERVAALIGSVLHSDGRAALDALAKLFDDGYQSGSITKQIIAEARQQLMSSSAANTQIIHLLEAVLESQHSANPSVALELALLIAAGPVANEKPIEKAPEIKEELPKPKQVVKEEVTSEPAVEKKEKSGPEAKKPEPAKSSKTDDVWLATLEAMKGSSNTLYGILRMAEASLGDNTLVLGFQFPFHMKRANEAKHNQILVDTLKKVTGKNYAITYEKLTIEPEKEKSPPKSTPKIAKQPEHDDSVQNVLSVFGGGEVVK